MRKFYGVLALSLLVLAGCGTSGNVPTSPLTWAQIPIASATSDLITSQGGYVVLADFDRDGRLDAASGFVSSKAVVVHMQSSTTQWTSTVIASGLGAVNSLAAQDFRNSGQTDLVAATAEGIRLMLAPAFSGPNPGPWNISTLSNPMGISTWNDVKSANLDDQSEPEIVATSVGGKIIGLWKASSLITSASSFSPYTIATGFSAGYERLALADIDNDGFTDIVGVGPDSGLIWLQNPSSPNITGSWIPHPISTGTGLTRVALDDLDKDEDIDVVVTDRIGRRVLWFENPGSPRTDSWPMHVIGTFTTGVPDALSVSELDNDGNPEILVGTQGANASIFWFEQFNDPRSTWQVYLADQTGYDVGEVPVGDIDGTGGPDFATTLAGSGTPVVWYQRQ